MTAEALRSGDIAQMSTMGLPKKRPSLALALQCFNAQLNCRATKGRGK